MWIFGPCSENVVHHAEPRKAAGYLELERARVRWFLSVDAERLAGGRPRQWASGPTARLPSMARRSNFPAVSSSCTPNRTEQILAGEGFGLDDARPSIDTVYAIRHARPWASTGDYHPSPGRGDPWLSPSCTKAPMSTSRQHRRGHQDLALLPYHAAHDHRRSSCSFGQNCVVGPRVTIGNGVRSRTTSRSTRASRWRTTCFWARRWSSPTWSIRAASSCARASTARP